MTVPANVVTTLDEIGEHVAAINNLLLRDGLTLRVHTAVERDPSDPMMFRDSRRIQNIELEPLIWGYAHDCKEWNFPPLADAS